MFIKIIWYILFSESWPSYYMIILSRICLAKLNLFNSHFSFHFSEN